MMKKSYVSGLLLIVFAVMNIQADYRNVWLAIAVVLGLVAVLSYTFWRSEQRNRN